MDEARRNRISVVGVLVVGMVLGAIFAAAVLWMQPPRGTVRVEWNADGAMSFKNNRDGPWIVTHVVEVEGETLGAVAALEPPLLLTESGRRSFPADQVKRLKWQERILGGPANAPAAGTPLCAVFVEGTYSPRE